MTLLIPAFLVLSMVLAPPLLGASTGWAQSKATTGQTTKKFTLPKEKGAPPATQAEAEAEKYAAKGWSVLGPVQISSADAYGLKIGAAPTQQTVSLAGKTLTVVNPDEGTAATAASLQPDTWIYVCQLESKVVVVLSPQTAKIREQRNDK